MRSPADEGPSYARRVAVLVVVGVVILAACSAGTRSSTGTTSTTAATVPVAPTSTSSTTTTTLPPTTTTEPLVVNGAFVKVANASGINGAATVISRELTKVGFTVRDATNALGAYTKLKVSIIFVVAGSEPVARSVSRLMGNIEIRPMTIPAWITDGTAGLGDATVLVMLGSDRAGKHLDQLG